MAGFGGGGVGLFLKLKTSTSPVAVEALVLESTGVAGEEGAPGAEGAAAEDIIRGEGLKGAALNSF
jgi:hypothetical protein